MKSLSIGRGGSPDIAKQTSYLTNLIRSVQLAYGNNDQFNSAIAQLEKDVQTLKGSVSNYFEDTFGMINIDIDELKATMKSGDDLKFNVSITDLYDQMDYIQLHGCSGMFLSYL